MLRVLHFFLAILVFVGSAGVTVNRHFCMGQLKSVALFTAAKKCHPDQQTASCPLHPAPADGEESAERKGCCNDEHEYLQLDEDRETRLAEAFPPIVSLAPELPPRVFPTPSLVSRTRKSAAFRNYRPPPLVLDVPSHWQVYRI